MTLIGVVYRESTCTSPRHYQSFQTQVPLGLVAFIHLDPQVWGLGTAGLTFLSPPGALGMATFTPLISPGTWGLAGLSHFIPPRTLGNGGTQSFQPPWYPGDWRCSIRDSERLRRFWPWCLKPTTRLEPES